MHPGPVPQHSRCPRPRSQVQSHPSHPAAAWSCRFSRRGASVKSSKAHRLEHGLRSKGSKRSANWAFSAVFKQMEVTTTISVSGRVCTDLFSCLSSALITESRSPRPQPSARAEERSDLRMPVLLMEGGGTRAPLPQPFLYGQHPLPLRLAPAAPRLLHLPSDEPLAAAVPSGGTCTAAGPARGGASLSTHRGERKRRRREAG